MKITTKQKAMVASYLRSFLAAVVAVVATGNSDWKALLAAGLSATLPVAIRAVNPKDPAFGLIADTAQIQIDKLAKADVKKKAVKKSA